MAGLKAVASARPPPDAVSAGLWARQTMLTAVPASRDSVEELKLLVEADWRLPCFGRCPAPLCALHAGAAEAKELELRGPEPVEPVLAAKTSLDHPDHNLLPAPAASMVQLPSFWFGCRLKKNRNLQASAPANSRRARLRARGACRLRSAADHPSSP